MAGAPRKSARAFDGGAAMVNCSAKRARSGCRLTAVGKCRPALLLFAPFFLSPTCKTLAKKFAVCQDQGVSG